MVVGAVWVTLAIASGLYFSFPVFFVALLEEFGWPRGATAAAFSISSIVQGAFSPVVGILVDRIGPRRVMLGGAFVLGSACVLASRIDSLWSLSLVTGVLAVGAVCRLRPACAGVVVALLRLPAHAAGRLLGRHPSGGLRRGPRLPTPGRGRHLRAHRFALDRRPDRVRRRGRPDRAHDLGDHL